MKISDITLVEGVSDNFVYHAVKPEHARKQLEDNKILGYTSQRCWPDGKPRKDDEADYEACWLLKGISTTRNIKYAQQWGPVVYILDKELIKQNYKVVPINWGFLIGGDHKQNDKKREAEEYIVLNVLKKSYDELGKEWERTYRDSEEPPEEFVNKFDYIFKPVGELKPLSKFLKGFMLSEYIIDIYGDEEMAFFTEHPLYRGTFKA